MVDNEMTNEDNQIKDKELKLSKIYHQHWNRFNKEQFDQSISLFAGRLKVNGFDLDWFKGKKCLDAGCGSGRYVQAMLDLGASEVVGLDLDPAVAQNKIANPKAKIIQGDIRKVPFENESFDFVCCNGVLHHTENPSEIVKELSRVLKKDGYFFLYVFDPDSVDWEIVDALRDAGQKFSQERLQAFLKKHLSLPENTMFNFCDFIYAPIQIRFTKQELEELFHGYEVRFLSIPFTSYDNPQENRLFAKKIF